MKKLFYLIYSLTKKLKQFVFYKKKLVQDCPFVVATEVADIAKHDLVPMVIYTEPIQINKIKEKIKKPNKSDNKNYDPNVITHKDFSDLMDSIDVIFQSFALPDDKMSWLIKRDAKALRMVGVHVPLPAIFINYKHEDAPTSIDMSKPLPVICCLSFAYKGSMEDSHKGNFATPVIQYAIKCGKLPYNVTQHSGIPYMLGTGYRFNTESSENDLRENQVNKLFWIHSYAVVSRETGNIIFCDELVEDKLLVRINNSAEKRNFNYATHKTIHRHSWSSPAYLKYRICGVDEAERWAKVIMREMFDFWAKRSERWQAAVYDGKNRVTFCVEYSKTKSYFKDRDKTVKAIDGKAKRIFHHVDAHTRVLKDGTVSSVKEHCRGLREFMWLNYQVKITAPKFTSELFTSEFDLEPTVFEQDEPMPNNMIDLAKTVQLLVLKEDSDRRLLH